MGKSNIHRCKKCDAIFTALKMREYLLFADEQALCCSDCFTNHVFGSRNRDLSVPIIFIVTFVILFFVLFFLAISLLSSGHYIAPLRALKFAQGNAILIAFPHVIVALFALITSYFLAGFALKLYRWYFQELFLIGESKH